ncbi:hypothetical protein DV096_02430 [Bradymonadaceae bacterium TMQ3]|nr:hypothetical protein DV096_02430 [Bradymonadaceae bacterium TMQ3]TXC77809.1 hypothetical protein FRC91_03480 [Bradymonadales bacterium TMQ1]
MEIRCEACKDVGPAAEVRAGTGGMELICAGCGHANLLQVAGAPEVSVDAQSRDGDASPAPGPIARAAAGSISTSPNHANPASTVAPGASLAEGVVEAAMARLIPVPGAGPRCPKCAHLVAGSEHCERCGLSQNEAGRYGPGQAPWEDAPAGKEDAFLQLNAAWARAEDGDVQAMGEFAELAVGQGLVEAGIRRVRFYLVDHPDDPGALDALRRLASALQARVTIAASQAAASAENFGKDVRRLRGFLLTITLTMCGLILLLLSAVFWDKC